jgi:hypothetical protein
LGHLTRHKWVHEPGRELNVKQQEVRLDALLFDNMGLKRWTIKDQRPAPCHVYKEY